MRTIVSVLLAFVLFSNGFSQKIPVLKSHTYTISVRDGDYFKKGRWNIEPKVNPDIYEAPMAIDKKYKLVTFITDIDSLQFKVEKGKTYPFVIIINGKDSAFTQIKTIQSPVSFTKGYIKSHEGKTFVEIPAVYELVNIVIALTNTGKTREGLVVSLPPFMSQFALESMSPADTRPVS